MPSENAMQEVWTAVDNYFGGRLAPSDSGLDAASHEPGKQRFDRGGRKSSAEPHLVSVVWSTGREDIRGYGQARGGPGREHVGSLGGRSGSFEQGKEPTQRVYSSAKGHAVHDLPDHHSSRLGSGIFRKWRPSLHG